MKNVMFIIFFAMVGILNLTAQSPSYVDWEWDIIKVGFVAPTGSTAKSDNINNGFSINTELRYNVRDDLSIGIAFEGAFFGTDFDEDNADIDLSSSFIVAGDYYFNTTSATRGFAGLGLGTYSDGRLEIRNGNAEEVIEGESSFGIAPRVGFELGHGRLMAQYNYAFNKETTDYFSVSLALTLWGGYKGN